MRYVTFRRADGGAAVGVVDGQTVRPLDGVESVVAADLASARLGTEELRLEDLNYLPVVVNPPRVFCVGLNYKAHVEESNRDLPTYPVLFPKFASNLIGHGEPVQVPPEAEAVDYEAELAVVIGKRGRRISREVALEHVLGYTASNDITMRDYQYKTHQWMQGKAWDRSTPLGPVLVTPDEIDPHRVDIKMRLNGEEMQSSNTSRLIFDIPTLIATISEFTELQVGDVILTGTPSGVGYRRDPRVVLKAGDVVEVEIEGIGVLHNTLAAEQGSPA